MPPSPGQGSVTPTSRASTQASQRTASSTPAVLRQIPGVGSAIEVATPIVKVVEAKQRQKVKVTKVVSMSRRSNRKLIRNALQYVCLAGGAIKSEREAVLELLDNDSGDLYMILLKKERSLMFKALLRVDLDTRKATKLYGDGPAVVTEDMVQHYFKYDSAAKAFKDLASQSFSPTTDAACLLSTWQRK